MKKFLLGFIAILLLGIFVFLGLIYFIDEVAEETVADNVEEKSEFNANDESSNESQEDDENVEEKNDSSKKKISREGVI